MAGLRPVRTVQELIDVLSRMAPDAEITLMPEEGDGFPIGGVLEFNAQKPREVWIIIDEFADAADDEDPTVSMDWSGGGTDDNPEDEGVERPGDMACGLAASCEMEEEDVVVVRGNMRGA